MIDLEQITHQWETADGSTPNGSVTFTLSGQLDGASEATSVSTQPIIAGLIDGWINQDLVPNVNEDLSPNGTFFWVREEIVGQPPLSYPITVPTGGPWDLYALRQNS